jgi:DNA repair protein RadC
MFEAGIYGSSGLEKVVHGWNRGAAVTNAMSWIDGRSGAAEEAPSGATCEPFTRIVRDPVKLNACMARASKPIENSRMIYDLVRGDLEKNDQETFVVICLDFRGHVRDYAQVAVGQRHRVAVDVEDILAVVLLSRADGVIVCHSHPSGIAEPSDADCDLTETIRNAMKNACPNVRLLDHCVIGLGQWYSFADNPPKKRKNGWQVGKVHKA